VRRFRDEYHEAISEAHQARNLTETANWQRIYAEFHDEQKKKRRDAAKVLRVHAERLEDYGWTDDEGARQSGRAIADHGRADTGTRGPHHQREELHGVKGMKWTSPKVGDTRIRRKLAWMPERCHQTGRRWWLCRVWVREVYSSPPAALTDYAGLWWATDAIGDAREDVEPTPEPVPEPKPCADCASSLGKRLQAQRVAADLRKALHRAQAEAEAEKARSEKRKKQADWEALQKEMQTKAHAGRVQFLEGEIKKFQQAAATAARREEAVEKLKAEVFHLRMQVRFFEANGAAPPPVIETQDARDTPKHDWKETSKP
jgi:hypothetical protein